MRTAARTLRHVDALRSRITPGRNVDAKWLRRTVGDDLRIVHVRQATGAGTDVAYIKAMADTRQIEALVLGPLRQATSADVARALPYGTPAAQPEDLVRAVLLGHTAAIDAGSGQAVTVDTAKLPTRPLSSPKSVTSLTGSQTAFNEDLDTNLGLLRVVLNGPTLRVRLVTAGRLSRTRVAVVHIAGVARPRYARDALGAVRRLPVDRVRSDQDVAAFLTQSTYTPFPLAGRTEQVSLAAAALADGRVAVLTEGSPFALLVPATLTGMVLSSQTQMGSPALAMFVRALRLSAITLALVAPGLYAALLGVDPGLMPPQLLTAVAATRQDLPYPVLLEDLVQIGILDAIALAAETAPGNLGQALTIVGSLIIGQSAVQAHLTSSIMVIVLSLVLIGSLLVQDLRLAYALRLLKYPITILGGVLGVVGVALGLLVLTVHLASLKSLGVPYLAPFGPMRRRTLAGGGLFVPPRPTARRRPVTYRPLRPTRW